MIWGVGRYRSLIGIIEVNIAGAETFVLETRFYPDGDLHHRVHHGKETNVGERERDRERERERERDTL